MYFDLSSDGVGRMVSGPDLELWSRGLTAAGVSRGWTLAGATSHYADEKKREPASPEYAGRAVVYLAMDPDCHRRSGNVAEMGELARAYGFRNVDRR